MTEPGLPGFKVKQVQRGLPFLPRGTYAGYWKFSDGQHTLLVEPTAGSKIRAAAAQALPRETGGLLAGRSLCDDDGQYMLVSGFTEARPGSGAPATFKIPVEDLGALRAQNALANPGADEVGWWHSHSGPSGYSSIDFGTQRMFEREDSVGLLVFARGAPWATAYIGPEAVHLGPPVRTRTATPAGTSPAGTGPAGTADPRVGSQPPPAPSGYPAVSSPGPLTGPFSPETDPQPNFAMRRAVVLAAAAIVLIAVAIVLAAAFRHRAAPQSHPRSTHPTATVPHARPTARASHTRPATAPPHQSRHGRTGNAAIPGT